MTEQKARRHKRMLAQHLERVALNRPTVLLLSTKSLQSKYRVKPRTSFYLMKFDGESEDPLKLGNSALINRPAKLPISKDMVKGLNERLASSGCGYRMCRSTVLYDLSLKRTTL